VGPEVADQFRKLFPEAGDLRRVDLSEANRRQLAACGIPSGQIDVAHLCTACNTAEFHSYRRDKDRSGRLVAAIRIDRE